MINAPIFHSDFVKEIKLGFSFVGLGRRIVIGRPIVFGPGLKFRYGSWSNNVVYIQSLIVSKVVNGIRSVHRHKSAR